MTGRQQSIGLFQSFPSGEFDKSLRVELIS
jgi:hypothetical protein